MNYDSRKIIATAVVAATMGLAGCTTNAADPSAQQTAVITVGGKRFAVPAQAKKTAHIGTAEEIDFFKKSGVAECRKGDVVWDTQGAQSAIAEAIKNGDASIHKKLAKEGRIGCAHPIEG